MSISIIGSNGKSLSIITDDKLLNLFNDIELEYNLLKDKYLEKDNIILINDEHYNHFLNQLIDLFNVGIEGDNSQVIINFIQKHNNLYKLYPHVKEMIKKYDLLLNLNNIISNIKEKLNLSNTDINHNLYKDIKLILKKIKNGDEVIDTKVNKTIINIETYLIDLKKEILKIKSIVIKKSINLECEYNKIHYKECIKYIITNLDNIINVNNIVQKNTIVLDKIINKITNELFILNTLI